MADIKTKKEVATKTPNLPAMPEGGWDDGDFESKDMLVPMICVAQGSSDVVKQDKAKASDIYETVNKTVLGGKTSPMPFVPIKYFKTWVHCELVNGTPEFRSVEPYTPANAGKYEYEQEIDGTPMRNYEVLNFYVLLEKELQEGRAFPYLLSFRSSNKKKGRALINHMARMRALVPPQPLCAMTFNLTSVLTSKDKNSWFVFDVAQKCQTSTEHIGVCVEWLSTLKTMQPKFDETALRDEMKSDDETDVTPQTKKNEVKPEARY